MSGVGGIRDFITMEFVDGRVQRQETFPVENDPSCSHDALREVKERKVRKKMDIRNLTHKPMKKYELLNAVMQQVVYKQFIDWEEVGAYLKTNAKACKRQWKSVFKLNESLLKYIEETLSISNLQITLPSNLKLVNKIRLVEAMLKKNSALFVRSLRQGCS